VKKTGCSKRPATPYSDLHSQKENNKKQKQKKASSFGAAGRGDAGQASAKRLLAVGTFQSQGNQ